MRHMSGPIKDLAPHAKTPHLSLVGVALHGRGRRDAVDGTVDVDAEGLAHAGRVIVCARPQITDVIGHPQDRDDHPDQGDVEIRNGHDGEASRCRRRGPVEDALHKGLVGEGRRRGVEDGGV